MKLYHSTVGALRYLVFVLLIIAYKVNASESIPTIDIHKIKPTELLTGPYSFFVPPYNFYYFHHMDQLDFQIDWIRRGTSVYPLQDVKKPFTTNYTYNKHSYTLEEYMKRNSVVGFLVLKDNQIIYENYLHGANQNSRFLTNSVGKSITSTLFGIALEEGKIKSIDTPVINYLPELSQSGFSRVTLKDALLMATGVSLSYNPYDPHSSTHQFNTASLTGVPSFMNLLKSVKANPKVKPGQVFDYENENSEVLGLVIEKAVGKPYNEYLQEKIWSKIGAQSDAYLYRAKAQPNQCTFGCLNATVRDYGRFGLMMMNGGILGETRVVGSSWVQQATTRAQFAAPMVENGSVEDNEDLGYGYQWWIPSGQDHAFEGMGIFGQILYVNPAKHIVIVQTASWPKPEEDTRWEESAKVMDAIVAKIAKDKSV